MTPREEGRFRFVWLVALLYFGALGIVASVNDWSVGWIYLAEITFFVVAVPFVHWGTLNMSPRARARSRRRRR